MAVRGTLSGGPVNGSDPGLGIAQRRISSWRTLVVSRVARDRDELARALTRKDTGADVSEARASIERLLSRAEAAAAQGVSPGRWVTGSAQDLAWTSLHEAEAEIDRILENEELVEHAKDLLRKARNLGLAEEERVTTVSTSLAQNQPLSAAEVAHLAQQVNDASDERYVQSRTYRNRLLSLTLLSCAFVGLVLLAFLTNSIPLPVKDVADPSYIQIALLIALFGAVGALISAVPSVARVGGSWNPFRLPFHQLLLKVALGPVFAILGVMMLQAGLIPDVATPLDLADLLVWATAFGAAQQFTTRTIDRKVKGLVADVEPKDS